MEVSNKKKKAIKRDYPGKSIDDLASEHKLSRTEVRSVLKEAGLIEPVSLKKPILVLAIAAIFAALAYCGYALINRPGPAKLARAGKDLNVLLVTIDTLRADHLGCYGYDKAKTPILDELASEGVLFENVFAHQPITLPSHATILTGLHPEAHGILDNGLFLLNDEAVTVAEIFKRKGYSTGGCYLCLCAPSPVQPGSGLRRL